MVDALAAARREGGCMTDSRSLTPAVTGIPFPRLARTSPRYRWWRPLAVGAVGLAIYLAVSIVIVLVAAIVAVLADVSADSGPFAVLLSADDLTDMSDPATLTLVLLSIIPMLPAFLLATRIVGARPVGTLSSVAGKVRWSWLIRCLGFAMVTLAVGMALTFGLAIAQGTELTVGFDHTTLAWTLAAIVFLVPLQAAAEEYIFRGFLMQMIGGWLRHPAFAILLPVPLFVLGHDYGLLGMLDVGLFAVVAGWITWRTGGLEAAIALHVVINVIVLILGAVGLLDPNESDGSLSGIAVTVITSVLFCWFVTRATNRLGILRVASPQVDVSSQPAGSMLPSAAGR
ncbi:MAG: family intrarane metalloprotease [Glaciihabitans sp.]|nr:family intrarane metalloprotease [Glaciihabitans sp.]